jgi:hypothetical protein
LSRFFFINFYGRSAMLCPMPKPGTKQESPISASAEAKATLARLANALGIRKIDLLDQAMKAMDDYVSHHNGRLILPLNFRETFQITTIDSERPMILHELPRAQSKPNVSEEHSKRNKPARTRAVRV